MTDTIQFRLGTLEAAYGSLNSMLISLIDKIQSHGRSRDPVCNHRELYDTVAVVQSEMKKYENCLIETNGKLSETATQLSTFNTITLQDFRNQLNNKNTDIDNLREMLQNLRGAFSDYMTENLQQRIVDLQHSFKVLADTIAVSVENLTKCINQTNGQQQSIDNLHHRMEQSDLLYSDLIEMVTMSTKTQTNDKVLPTPIYNNHIAPVDVMPIKSSSGDDLKASTMVQPVPHQWFFGENVDSAKKLKAGDIITMDTTKTFGISCDNRVVSISKDGNYTIDVRAFLRHEGESALSELAMTLNGDEFYVMATCLQSSNGINWTGTLSSVKVVHLSAGDTISLVNKGCDVIVGSNTCPLTLYIHQLN